MAQNATQEQSKQQNSPRAIDPSQDEITTLLAHGFKCIGNPEWESARWYDGSKPFGETVKLQPRIGKFPVRDKDDNKKVIWEERPIKQRQVDGFGTATEVEVKQLVYTPEQRLLTRQEALIQIMRLEHDKLMQKARATEKVA